MCSHLFWALEGLEASGCLWYCWWVWGLQPQQVSSGLQVQVVLVQLRVEPSLPAPERDSFLEGQERGWCVLQRKIHKNRELNAEGDIKKRCHIQR